MSTPNDRSHTANPDHAATDPRNAAKQDQIKADHERLAESARRVEASVQSDGGVQTDRTAAAQQDRVKADHDRLAESARRVEASVPANVRDTPVQPANLATNATEDDTQSIRNVDAARDNADAARESARRVEQSVPEGTNDRDRR